MRIKKKNTNLLQSMSLDKYFTPNNKGKSTKISFSPSNVSSTSDCTRTIPHSIATESQIKSIVKKFDNFPYLKKNLFSNEENLNLNNINDRNINLIIDSDQSMTNRSDITKKLAVIFNNKGGKILQKSPKKETRLNNFRQKVINDFSDETTIEKIEASKKTFKNFMKYLETREKERIEFAKNLEKQFYQTKLQQFTASSKPQVRIKLSKKLTLSNKNSFTQSDFMKNMRRYKIYERKMNKSAGKNLADAIFEMDCPEYEDIQQGKSVNMDSNNINLNNLERKIKLSKIKKYSYDIDGDVLLVKNAYKLKNLIHKTKEAVNFKVRNNNPHFVKRQFSQETIKKYREFNGVFFGLPV